MTRNCGPGAWSGGFAVDRLNVHILFRFREGPWGGCNQFLTALRDEFMASGNWADSPDTADVVLFDSFNEAREVMNWKRRLPRTPFVQRIDGPISIYRGRDSHLDRLIHAFGERIAEGIVFQSDYSRQANIALGMPEPRFSTVILNAPQAIFKSTDQRPAADRIRIVAVSWSANWNKGFDILAHLDRHLDFSRYEVTFVGNSPVKFQHIRQLPPQSPAALAELLPSHDIFFTASRHEACSNALAEALAAGLPAVALRSGGNPEQVGRGGILFDGTADVIERIDALTADVDGYRRRIRARAIAEVAAEYLRFLAGVCAAETPRRRLTLSGLMVLQMHLALRRALLARDRLLRTWRRG